MASDEGQFDVYADQFSVAFSPYGVTMFLQRSPASPVPGQSVNDPVGIVRMSLEHTKVLTMILRRQLKAFESEHGITVAIPSSVLNDLGLSPEDWDRI